VERTRRIDGPLRPTFVYPPTIVHRHTREDVSSRLLSHPSRPVQAPSSRRASDQDLILPSVEREPGVSSAAPLEGRRQSDSIGYHDVQTPKRKSFPSSVYSSQGQYIDQAAKRTGPVYDEAYAQSQPRVQPPYGHTNLTSSPLRHRESYAGTSRQAYVHESAWNSPRAHVSEYDRSYSGRALAPVEYSAARNSAHMPPDGSRYRLR
jgi:hypothetical protein